MDENTRAISFANSYFALVDGLASGLESHLSEDVVLDWFGRTVKGRRNVSAFMDTHKVNSRHRFARIVPIDGIGYKKKHLNRRKFRAYDDSRDDRQTDRLKNDSRESGKRGTAPTAPSGTFTPETETRGVAWDINRNEIDWKETSGSDVFAEGDLCDLFNLDISAGSGGVQEIERSINRMKLEEEMAPTMKPINGDRGRGADGTAVENAAAVKYVEAEGEIEFSRKFWKKDAWNAYFSATSNVHTWRRPCKLQIAYTPCRTAVCPESAPATRNKNVARRDTDPGKARLPSLEEIGEISNRLVPNTNDFAGFLKDVDFFVDRKDFLERLETEMTMKEPTTPLFAPQYVEDRLVYEKPCVHVHEDRVAARKTFLFNYQIHLIVYEGGSKCKMNLLHEFERTKF